MRCHDTGWETEDTIGNAFLDAFDTKPSKREMKTPLANALGAPAVVLRLDVLVRPASAAPRSRTTIGARARRTRIAHEHDEPQQDCGDPIL